MSCKTFWVKPCVPTSLARERQQKNEAPQTTTESPKRTQKTDQKHPNPETKTATRPKKTQNKNSRFLDQKHTGNHKRKTPDGRAWMTSLMKKYGLCRESAADNHEKGRNREEKKRPDHPIPSPLLRHVKIILTSRRDDPLPRPEDRKRKKEEKQTTRQTGAKI